MEKRIQKSGNAAEPMHLPYVVARILLLLTAALLFFPGVSPAQIVRQAGQSKISATASLFTSGISYSSLVNGLGRAFTKGWLNEAFYVVLFIGCMVTLIGIAVAGVGCAMSLGNLRMKNVGNRFLFGGGAAVLAGVAAITAAYFLIVGSADPDRITH